MPAATTTPSTLTTNIHSAKTGKVNVCPVRSANAGMGAASPAEIIDAADDAVVWLMLFSRNPYAGVAKVFCAVVHKAKPISPAATDMLKVQPILSPL